MAGDSHVFVRRAVCRPDAISVISDLVSCGLATRHVSYNLHCHMSAAVSHVLTSELYLRRRFLLIIIKR